MIGILTEKPSQARNFGKALGGMTGTYKGEKYKIVNARGHLYEFVQPHEQVPKDLSDRYKSWNLEYLPWNLRDFSWKRKKSKDASGLLSSLKSDLNSCDEICIATDVDPTGEGQLIAWEVIDELKLHNKKITRMYFMDESESEIQKAFVGRKTLPKMEEDPEYLKATYRTRWDFLSMQFTRIASKNGADGAVLRQGRLKSAMVFLVGEQLDKVKAYKKVPFYQNKFKDENGNVYTNPNEELFDKKEKVPSKYEPSSVQVLSKTRKSTKPKKLLDLAELSSILAGKGLKAQTVLNTYQKMYEAQIVSYPRTEDKHMTPEQFNELLPLADRIAGVVGVDRGLLTYRKPRASHVKDGGAHGANRPGKNVPGSLDELDKFGPGAKDIYELLARSFLSILAEDYVYEQEKGELAKYPEFKGSVNVPVSMGWKAVLYNKDNPDEDNQGGKSLGKEAKPFIHEGFPPKPAHPTMKWLMKQLENHDVGTGATRTSTYAEVTKAKSATNKYPLLSEKRGKIDMTEFGQMSYKLLPGTKIGDLKLTENLYKEMDQIAKKEATMDFFLNKVAEYVTHDLKQMQINGERMRKELGLTMANQKYPQREKCEGVWAETGQKVRFNRDWGGHRFSDEECQALLDGEMVLIEGLTNKKGNGYSAEGKLELQNFKGRDFIGFKMIDYIPED